MQIFLLGAGRPARGHKPSALKDIARNTKAMDWQLHSFADVAAVGDIHYLGGYHVSEVIETYPQLNFTVIPDWQERSVVHTLLKAPLGGSNVLIAYSDTVFRKEVVEQLLEVEADVVYGVDPLWRERYDQRPQAELDTAETIVPESGTIEEFTGLLHLSVAAASRLRELSDAHIGSTLPDLIEFLRREGFSAASFDVSGHWAEFNIPEDVARFILGTKAETLARLEPLVKHSHIGKQISFTCSDWQRQSNDVLARIDARFPGAFLVVRSSSGGEDNWASSNAGGFTSILEVEQSDANAVSQAIESVIDSYGDSVTPSDQVLVQEFLKGARFSGVVFTCSLETGGPYYRINFDGSSSSTESVTSGLDGDLRTVIASRFDHTALSRVEPELLPVMKAVVELEELLGFDRLDIEFAIDSSGKVHIFQARPVVVDHSAYESGAQHVEANLKADLAHFREQQAPSPFVHGDRAIFANMPDWNPAEIIGVRPRPLAFSLYRYLITDEIWATQRAQFGYRDVRPCPLIHTFSGQPYVDARASLNSFIPAALDEAVAGRIAAAYLAQLANNTQLHDKIEFEVAFTIWTPTFDEIAVERLAPRGVTTDDIAELGEGLKAITRNALTRLETDVAPSRLLTPRREKILAGVQPRAMKIRALLEDCRQMGTLAFSHAARAGFVATTLLKSFVTTGGLTEDRRQAFLQSFSTVAGEFEDAKHKLAAGDLSMQDLLAEFGHLRPGTYEVTATAYWEEPDRYISDASPVEPGDQHQFEFTPKERRYFKDVLLALESSVTVDDFILYLERAIVYRESVKFEFTRNLSAALDVCVQLGEELGLPRSDCAYLEYSDIEKISLNAITLDELKGQILRRREAQVVTSLVELPGVICSEDDFFCFERHSSQPNFVTGLVVDAPIQVIAPDGNADLRGKIVMIPQADPGYDWILGQGIAGLLTQYGGANSHMAIRAAELGLPAAIGIGEKLYERFSRARRVMLDCAGQTIRELH